MADQTGKVYGQSFQLTANTYTKAGYSFSGWSKTSNGAVDYANQATVNNINPSANNAVVTLYAVWAEASYTITFDKQGGAGGTDSAVVTYNAALPTATAPSKAGYTFGGYYTAVNGGGTQYYDGSMAKKITAFSETANKTLYAKWTANTYSVKYNPNGATTGSAQTEAGWTYGTAKNLKTLSSLGWARTGYDFEGWATTAGATTAAYTDGQSITTSLTATNGATVELFAVWTVQVNENDRDFGAGAVVNNTFNVYNETDWNAAKAAISGGGNDKNYIINIMDNFSIAGSTDKTFGTVTGVKVSIRGKKNITLSSNGNALFVYENQTVILSGPDLVGISGNNNYLVYFYDGGYFAPGGAFHLVDGKIRDNGGGGVCLYGMSSLNFTMTGGVISGNTRTGNGAGVYVNSKDTAFVMRGGEISGNSASGNGGGVYIENRSSSTQVSARIYGGKITGNTAGGKGGGIYIASCWDTYIFACEIKGNHAATAGGGIRVEPGAGSVYNTWGFPATLDDGSGASAPASGIIITGNTSTNDTAGYNVSSAVSINDRARIYSGASGTGGWSY
jgi:uncharacterized repeat protein (TIGR02543 family)